MVGGYDDRVPAPVGPPTQGEEHRMTTTPDPLSDDDIETTTPAHGPADAGDADGADGTDAPADSDGTDGDAADTTDGDSHDADGTDS